MSRIIICRCRIFLSFLALLSGQFSYSQNPRYWIQSAGGTSDDEGYDISVDDSNNVYTTGNFTGTIDFVNNGSNKINLQSNGVRDVFICKNDTTGKYLWAVKAGGPYLDRGNAITTDNNGNVYVTGFFSNTANFSGVQVAARGFHDFFIAKYNTGGILQWVRTGGGPKNDMGNAVAVDAFGNVIITGQFSDTAYFDSYSLVSKVDSFTSTHSVDVFTVKYDSSGTIQWVKKGSSKYTDRGLDIGCDPQGNIYVTGQFSDTVMFDNVHFNTMYNAIFLIKYDGNGNEQWFTKAGGGTLNVAYGLAVNDSGYIFLTGDYKNQLLFYGSLITTLTGVFSEGIFLAKYNNNGDLVWAKSSGSDNYITSRNLALDDSSNAYIIGNFKCILSEYSNFYGAGCFNSVGFTDIFVSKFNNSGQWQWSRNYGGKFDDYGRGICVNHFYQPLITGSFNSRIVIPRNTDFNFTWGTPISIADHAHLSNCNDSAQYNYQKVGAGMNDVFILNSLDPKISPYYYYATAFDTFCTRPFAGVSIGINASINMIDPDTVEFCNQGLILSKSMTGGSSLNSAGPLFNYLWSTGNSNSSLSVNSSGMYSVTQTSQDGCFESTDSIYVIIHPLPGRPKITDNKGINSNTDVPSYIGLCDPDSVQITVNNAGPDSIVWSGSGTSHDSIYNFNTVNLPNHPYSVSVYFVDSNGCRGPSTQIGIGNDTALAFVIPKLKLQSNNDTVQICSGEEIRFFIYDSITDPAGMISCYNNVFVHTHLTWTITPGAFNTGICNTGFKFSPTNSGVYTVTSSATSSSGCGGLDSFILSMDVYVIVNPNPPQNSIVITGDSMLCPGDSAVLFASIASNYNWTSFPNNMISGNRFQSTVEILGPGTFTVTARDTNVFGCTSTSSKSYIVSSPSPPYISINPPHGIICPGDSIELLSTSNTNHWIGPAGQFSNNSSVAYASIPGEYYSISDSASCSFASNVLEVFEYSTPYLLVTPSEVICPGSSVDLEIISNANSIIQWQAPLSGSSTIQSISVPGTYTCSITSCGLTNVSVTLFQSTVTASIDSSGPLSFCLGDSVTLFANPGMVMYEWSPDNYINPLLVVSQPGNYSVTTTDGYGCTAVSAPVTVSLTNNIPVPLLSSNSPICAGDTLLLNSDASSGFNFQWTGPGGFFSNAESPSISGATLNDSGSYSLTITQGTCINSATIQVDIDSLPTILTSTTGISCINSTDTLKATFVSGAVYSWLSPGGINYTANEIYFPSLQYSDSGTYELTVTYGSCVKNLNYFLNVVNSIAAPVISTNSPLCFGDTLRLNSNSPSGIYNQWTGPNGFNSGLSAPEIPNLIVADSGIYSLTISQGVCSNVASVFISIDSLPDVQITSNNPMCLNSSANVVALTLPGALYSWNTPSGTNYTAHTFDIPALQYSDSGNYHLTVTRGNCTKHLDWNLKINDCSFTIPNVFTPNKDGLNDYFKIDDVEIEKINCKIYNRWGGLIYSWDTPDGKWDGTDLNSGKSASSGVYFYIINIKLFNEEPMLFKGTVDLIGKSFR